MHFNWLGVVAAVAGLSQAFLVPPEISSADADIIKTLPFEDAVGIDGRIVEINCPGCPVVTDIEGKMYSAQVESILQLNFSLSHDDADQLLLNGVQIYPVDHQSKSFMQPLTASQMIKAHDGTWQYVSTPKLGYSVGVGRPITESTQDQLDLVSIHLEIIQVADKFLEGLPTIDIKLLETPSGKLMIGTAEITAPKSPASSPTDDGQECTTLVCKWRAIVADRLSKLKGCGSKSRPEAEVRPVFVPKTHHKHHGHGRPRPHGPHRPYRHHHRHGGFARFLRGIVMHVFIPVLIGIMVGITASVVGMFVGHIVIFTWRMLFRHGQRSQYTLAKQEETDEDTIENTKASSEQDAPPKYEEAVVEKEDSA